MSLRTRLLLAFAVVVFVPLAVLAFGLREYLFRELSREYELRLEGTLDGIRQDLGSTSAGIADRLASLERALLGDNRFRRAAVAGDPSEREYLLDYAGTAMQLTGLSMLQILDDEHRVISSGQFRNEYGRIDAALAPALARRQDEIALVTAHAPDGSFLALVRASSLRIADRAFTLVGGVAIDDAFLARLDRDRDITVLLFHPDGSLSSDPGHDPFGGDASSGNDAFEPAVAEIPFELLRSRGDGLDVMQATLVVVQPREPLRLLLRDVNGFFLLTAAGTGLVALLLAVWVSSRISRPLAALAEKTAVLDLDRLDVEFDEGTDEVGRLSRLLGDLAARLRTSTGRIREAERRATVGDLARQINHDIKNGLIPLRNVLRHLAEVGRDDPGALASVFAERRPTIDSSIDYLETLATNYQRLSAAPSRRDCDVNALVSDVVRAAHGYGGVEIRTTLDAGAPRVTGDPVAIRRVLENLLANAVDSLESKPGRITISTGSAGGGGEPPVLRLTVADTGRGMSKEESERIFRDFYTTKTGGTGLGLSIVRRLVMDLHGTIRVESDPGAGTRMIVEIPARGPATGPAAAADPSGTGRVPAPARRSRFRRST